MMTSRTVATAGTVAGTTSWPSVGPKNRMAAICASFTQVGCSSSGGQAASGPQCLLAGSLAVTDAARAMVSPEDGPAIDARRLLWQSMGWLLGRGFM